MLQRSTTRTTSEARTVLQAAQLSVMQHGVAYEDLVAGAEADYATDPAAAALVRELDRKKASRSLAVPTNDGDIRTRLRDLGEPITLFGERREDRRDRLRYIVSQITAASGGSLEAPESDSSSDESDEEFYTEGTAALLAARRSVAQYSLRKARQRVERQRREADIALGAILNLRKAVYKELRTYTTYSSEVGDDRPLSVVRFSPNSSLLASGSWSGLVKLWDAPSCRHRATLKGHGADRIGGLAWHPSATLTQSPSAVNLATGAADGNIQLWSLDCLSSPVSKGAAYTTSLSTLRGHEHRVCRIAFHPAGRLLGSASFDETWRLWDVETGTAVLAQEGHSKEVYAIAFQDDGALVCSGGLDAIGRVWDLRTGRTIMVLDSHVKDILAIDFAPNGYQIATGSNDDTIRIWDLRQLKATSSTIAAHKKSVTDLCFYRPASEDMVFPSASSQASGSVIANGQSNGDIDDSMDATGDRQMDADEVHPPLAGIFLASSGHDGYVRLWSADDWQLIKGISVGDDNKATSVDLARNGRYLATGEWSRNLRIIAPEG